MGDRHTDGGGLRRELGTIESYAALVGILVGAGIFRVTSDASALTGAGVIVGHLVLAPAVLATAVAYMVFLSTPLGLRPGGEAMHVARTFGRPGLGFLGAWLKSIAYLGAGAFLAGVLADFCCALLGVTPAPWARTAIATGFLLAFLLAHLRGVRWFGRLQVWLCVLLGVAILILVVPGTFAIERRHLRPLFPEGASGFVAALPPLFFAYAGFESLAQTAGEVRDAPRRLPAVFARGTAATAVIFVWMSLVAFGALPASVLQESEAPMSDAAATFLPFGAEGIVTLGAILAVATSLNATMLVPARLAWSLAQEGQLPRALGAVRATTGVPVAATLASFAIAALLLLSDQMALALDIAVVALVLLYALHSAAAIALPRCNPELAAQVTTPLPRGLVLAAAAFSLVAMIAIAVVQFVGDVTAMTAASPLSRWGREGPTSLELLVLWSAVGWCAYQARPRPGR